MRVLSVDLGTSNTVAVLSIPGMFPRLVEVDGASVLPSAVFADEGGRLVVGREALRLARTRPERFEANPKRRIDDGELLLGDAVVPVVRAFTAVLGRVAGEASRQLDGGGFDDVRLTHPASWGLARRRVLADAARSAGLGVTPVLIAEPVAAAAHFAAARRPLAPGEAIAVYDLGAGTFDVAVVGRTEDGFEVLADDGLADFGGVDVDQALLDHVGLRAARRDEQAWLRLLRPQTLSERRARRALLSDVIAAKETLSHHEQTEVVMPDPFEDVLVTRGELEELVRPALRRSVDVLAATIRAAGRTPQTLAGIYLVGGSSRIPLAARLIGQQLGVVPTTLDQPETTVALGAHHVSQVAAPVPVTVAAPLVRPVPEVPLPQQEAPRPEVPNQAPPPPISGPVPVQAVPEEPKPSRASRIARVTGAIGLLGAILVLAGLFLEYGSVSYTYTYDGDYPADSYTHGSTLATGAGWAFVVLGLVAVAAAVWMWARSAWGPGLVTGVAGVAVWALVAMADQKVRGLDVVKDIQADTGSDSSSGAFGPGFWVELVGYLLLLVAGIGALVTIARERGLRLRLPHDAVLIGTALVAILGAVGVFLQPHMSLLSRVPVVLLVLVPVLAVILLPRRFGAAVLLGWAVAGLPLATALYAHAPRDLVEWPGIAVTGSFVVLALLALLVARRPEPAA